MQPTFTLAQQLVLMLFILGISTPKAVVSQSQCEQCLVTTHHGNKVTKTFVYHSHYNCKEQTTSCVHNTITYEICPNNGNPICFNPQGSQFALDVEITGSQEGGVAQEGGVCRKCNPNNRCLQFDDSLKVVEESATRIRKLTHVPVQIWGGAVDFNSFGGIFSGWKRIGFLVLLALEVSFSSPVSLL
ncbi:PREDICTED: endogenous retrovirus group 3 member 1 Env polyprotein-like [Thamnophis sirtalis]|uniref:Endogenous retrovirus group 3 member 1 Env polyprotein-like n=1 Tax=Thamnophis sirtalis TaxID=35019 RepID=A0A6I9Y8C0_9SAUR|nr:PREDICTED: endogenous retrovirus group 3 member 1 Env polyprotein-like [Thamnophis sirtalis]